jgi:hypothetical protein
LFRYFEVVECMRRLFLSAIPALILPGTSVQVIIVLLFSLCFAGLYAEAKPFTVRSDSVVAIATEWGVTLTLLLGLMIQVAEMEDSVSNTQSIGISMVAINVCVLVFTMYKFAYNNDDKHSSALDSFKRSRQKKRSSAAAERAKRGSSVVSDLFTRVRARVSRLSVTRSRANTAEAPNLPPDAGTTVSPMSGVAAIEVEMSAKVNARPPSPPKLTCENVRERIRERSMHRMKDSDDDDSDDDSDQDEEAGGLPAGGAGGTSKRKSKLEKHALPPPSEGGIVVSETWGSSEATSSRRGGRNWI